MTAAREAPRVCLIRRGSYDGDKTLTRRAAALVKEGYRVDVLCARGHDGSPSGATGAVCVLRLGPAPGRTGLVRRTLRAAGFFAAVGFVLTWRHVRDAYRIIELHNPPDYLAFATLVPRLAGARLIVDIRRPSPESLLAGSPQRRTWILLLLVRLVERLAIEAAHRVIVGTRVLRDHYGDRGIDVNKVVVVLDPPAGIAAPGEAPDVTGLRREERRKGVFRIVCHGELAGYDLDGVVHALAGLKDRVPGAQLRIMGEGNVAQKALDTARHLGIGEQVRYLGSARGDSLLEELLAADVGIVPLERNPLSRLLLADAVYDQIDAAKPVITPRLDATLSYFGEDTLFFYDAGDTEGLSDVLYGVFAHPEAVGERVARAVDVAAAHGWERECTKYLGLYAGLANAGRTIV